MRFIHIKNSSFEFSSSICAGVTSSSAVWGIVVLNISFIHCWNSTFGCTIKSLPSLFGGILKLSSQQISSYPIAISRRKLSPLWAKTQVIVEPESEPICTILVSPASFLHSTHIEPSDPLRANTQSRYSISAASSRSLPQNQYLSVLSRFFSSSVKKTISVPPSRLPSLQLCCNWSYGYR